MAGWEQTIIVGNVGRDPEIKFLPSGTQLASFSVAVTTRWNDRQTNEKREKTNWYSCSVFGRQAEVVQQYVKKGMQIMVIGTVSARAYKAQDGEPRASLDLKVDSFQFLSGGNEGGGSGNYSSSSSGGGSSSGGYDDFSPPPSEMDDIPF